jgi:hypothetical protein
VSGDKKNIIIYNTVDGKASVSLYARDGMVRMNQNQIAELFDTSKQNIGQHIANILEEGELQEVSVVKDFFTTAADGKQYNVTFYALDMVLAIGFRVRGKRGTQVLICSKRRGRCKLFKFLNALVVKGGRCKVFKFLNGSRRDPMSVMEHALGVGFCNILLQYQPPAFSDQQERNQDEKTQGEASGHVRLAPPSSPQSPNGFLGPQERTRHVGAFDPATFSKQEVNMGLRPSDVRGRAIRSHPILLRTGISVNSERWS